MNCFWIVNYACNVSSILIPLWDNNNTRIKTNQNHLVWIDEPFEAVTSFEV